MISTWWIRLSEALSVINVVREVCLRVHKLCDHILVLVAREYTESVAAQPAS